MREVADDIFIDFMRMNARLVDDEAIWGADSLLWIANIYYLHMKPPAWADEWFPPIRAGVHDAAKHEPLQLTFKIKGRQPQRIAKGLDPEASTVLEHMRLQRPGGIELHVHNELADLTATHGIIHPVPEVMVGDTVVTNKPLFLRFRFPNPEKKDDSDPAEAVITLALFYHPVRIGKETRGDVQPCGLNLHPTSMYTLTRILAQSLPLAYSPVLTSRPTLDPSGISSQVPHTCAMHIHAISGVYA